MATAGQAVRVPVAAPEAVAAVVADRAGPVPALVAAHRAELGDAVPAPDLPLYWSDEERVAYELRLGVDVVGFALVRREEGSFEMAEFHVRPAWRRQGLGRQAVAAVLALHPGPWEVRPCAGRAVAERFWSAVLPGAERRREGGRTVFRLHVATAPA